jgi:L-ascorbate metabolism protein UlaG (beta-lactamase superfamily)
LSVREIAAKKLHHGPGYFLNPLAEEDHPPFSEVIKWKLFSANDHKDQYKDEPVRPVTIDWEPIKAYPGLSVTFLRHASLLIRDPSATLIIDPVFNGLFSFIRDFSPRAFSLDEMPRPDLALITHGHYDHLDAPSLAALNPKPHVVCPLGYGDVLDDIGLEQRTFLDWYDSFQYRGWTITLAPANHWTMRQPYRGRNRALWGSFVIQAPSGFTLFVSGDVAWFDGYRELGREFPVDLAVFNLGAYEPRWFMKKSHMNPAEVVRAFEDLNARRLTAVHWGTFRLGDEPVHAPPRDLKNEMERKGLAEKLVHLDPGQTLYINGRDFPG